MKVVELARSFYPSVGGLEKFISDRFNIYDMLKIDYRLVCTDFTTEKIDTTKKYKNVKYLKQYSPYNITPGIKSELDKDFDILSVNQIGRFFSDYAIYYAKKKKKTVILTPHFYFHTNKYSLLKSIHKKVITANLLKYIDILICFTNYEADFWKREFGIKKEKIRIIPHYVKLDHLTNGNKSTDISSSDKYFLYLGRNDKNKRIDLLLHAFDEISSSSDYNLFLTVRPDDLTEELRSISERNKKIKLLGYVSENEKKSLLTGASALVLPTEFEAFGNVILESSINKKPILCSSLPVLKEIVDANGAVFFDNNVSSIKEALNKFIHFSDDERRYAGNTNFRNLNRFSFNIVKEKYEELFEELVSCDSGD